MYLDLVYEELEPLKELGIEIPSTVELELVKKYLNRTRTDKNTTQVILKRLQPVKDAFPTTFIFFKAVETFGNSTTINEASFSTLSRIDTKFRFSSTNERLRNLTFIAFEKKILSNIDDEDILHQFVNQAPNDRRIQLF